ncbi:MAG TPA: hypothetical protein VGI54_09140, partial [Solirubrobacteraceae bacterium]
MQLSRVDREELISVLGGIILAIGLFLPWYSLGNQFTHLNNVHGPDATLSGWQALTYMRYLFLAAAVAPLILTYISLRGHALSWPRGEVTALVGVAAFALVLIRGVVLKPGDPTSQVSLELGWFVSLIGAGLLLGGALFHREAHDTTAKKPPGVM